MHKLIKVLTELGVDFDNKDHKSYHFKADGMMDLSVETWLQPDGMHLSVAHYGEQNGDLMADPEMESLVGGGEIGPISFRNDYLGLMQYARWRDENGKEMINPGLILELRAFARKWAETIRRERYRARQSKDYLSATEFSTYCISSFVKSYKL